MMVMCLQQGWKVRATTRSPGKHSERLKSLVPEGVSADLLEIVQLDLLDTDEGKFDEAVRGCDAVLHTASPFFIKGATMENVVKPAVEGTRRVLDAVLRAKIRDVVLTSSTAAIYAWYGCHEPDHIMTEEDWSSEETMIANGSFYPLGKTRAEKLAWEMAKGGAFRLAVMNPCLIFGPMLQPQLNTSSGSVASYLNGEKAEIVNCTKCIVDVRDVALAHILALQNDKSWGNRHLLVSDCPHWKEIVAVVTEAVPAEAQQLRERLPKSVSKEVGPAALGAPPPHTTPFNVSRAKELGVSFRSTKEMVSATVKSLLKWGLVSDTMAAGEAKQGQ